VCHISQPARLVADLLVTANNGRAALLRNEGGNRNHWLAIRPRGVKSNRDGLGTRVVLQVAGRREQAWVRSGASYCSDSEHVARFVRHLLDVFDLVWNALKEDGCLWVNLADTYNNKQGKKGTTNAPDGSNGRFAAGGRGYATSLRQQPEFYKHYIPGIAHKSEMGVPLRFHLAMTDSDFRALIGAPDGPQWTCRRTVIWAKSLVRVENQTAEDST